MEDTPEITHAQPIQPNHKAIEMPPPAVGLVHEKPKAQKAKRVRAAPKAKAAAKPKAPAKKAPAKKVTARRK